MRRVWRSRTDWPEMIGEALGRGRAAVILYLRMLEQRHAISHASGTCARSSHPQFDLHLRSRGAFRGAEAFA